MTMRQATSHEWSLTRRPAGCCPGVAQSAKNGRSKIGRPQIGDQQLTPRQRTSKKSSRRLLRDLQGQTRRMSAGSSTANAGAAHAYTTLVVHTHAYTVHMHVRAAEQ